MHPAFVQSDTSIPIHCLTAVDRSGVLAEFSPFVRRFVESSGFDAAAGSHCLIPDSEGGLLAVLFGVDVLDAPGYDPFSIGRLATVLPEGVYRIEGSLVNVELAALGFLLGSYRFGRYRSKATLAKARLVAPAAIDRERIERIVAAVAAGRDLINTPANDLGPAEIEAEIRGVATAFGATVTSIVGDDLLSGNFPMVHAVGRASTRAPRLVDLVWGDPAHPKVTLVGKGVAFDTGGLNVKPGDSMTLMKKDMGGAAVALAAARMVMAAGLPVRLRLIVPTVENSISGDAFRPGDVLQSRKGLTVEIGNTDAEGRLILGDALALGDEDAPDLMLDFATLTGAARVALGPDLPPVYTDDETLAGEIAAAGAAVNDPVWRMPLWKPYAKLLESKVADINHISSGSYAGSVTAALFLQRFVEKVKAWAHFDVFCWVPTAKPGVPQGGEVQAARLVFELLERRYRPK